MQGTSYEEIAQEAGVAQATVYRHFPTLSDLIPACARSIQVLQPLTPEAAANLFHGHPYPSQRLEWIIRETCACYARDWDWLNAARREGDLVPALSDVISIQQESLRMVIRAALEGTNVSERSVQVLAALMDFPLWKSFRDVGLNATDATDQVLELVQDHLMKETFFDELTFSSPAGFANFVRAAREPAPRLVVPPPGPMDIERLSTIAAQYGIEIIGPPPE